MIDWTWIRKEVSPQDILDAADTLAPGSSWYQVNLVEGMRSSESYMQWALDCLHKSDAFGWDAAVCYAKRAVCRRIDGILLANHLGESLGRSYPEKLSLLMEIGVYAPEVVHELVIDPRNEVEHGYSQANERQAKRAVELATLFMMATNDESQRPSIITLGNSLGMRHQTCSAPGRESDNISFSLRRDVSPMLLVDCAEPSPTRVYILRPCDGELISCALSSFGRIEAIGLAKLLRRYHDLDSFSSSTFGPRHLRNLRDDLGL